MSFICLNKKSPWRDALGRGMHVRAAKVMKGEARCLRNIFSFVTTYIKIQIIRPRHEKYNAMLKGIVHKGYGTREIYNNERNRRLGMLCNFLLFQRTVYIRNETKLLVKKCHSLLCCATKTQRLFENAHRSTFESKNTRH